MSDIAIRVENLSKQYQIGRLQKRHDTLRDRLADIRLPSLDFLKRSNGHNQPLETFWALKDVSFEVKRGEVVGVIGRNGAGKSTLLKILSRITKPTSGRAEIHGRVGSLLEVGTGFHPELTGRENIYLNGAILGMKHAEIDRKFDEIVAFAEVEKFIDTPVKRYSSGMYVRLAFAVAAYMESEILLVDEVLAVGDAAFQKKCLGKMGDVANEGRTVLFVSHNLAALSRLCPMSMWLNQGVVAANGSSRSTIASYLLSSTTLLSQRVWPTIEDAPGDEFLRAISVSIADATGQGGGALYQDRSFTISISYTVLKPMMNANVGFEIKTDGGTIVFASYDADHPEWSGIGRQPGRYLAEAMVPANLLNEGIYYLTLSAGLTHYKVCMRAEDVLRLEIRPPVTGEGPAGRMGARRPGVVVPQLSWRVQLVT